ncbi:carbohydrate ABC transporter permease [Leifsonia sp. LS-T14]|uniref:carbohydrate ABC transporter permease n=1 Tax=unclassified Leifsonia TaxID=2663824 RepID=UPI0035A6489A
MRPSGAANRKARPIASTVGRVVGWVVLALFLVFFVIPIIWLLLAATKTQLQIVNDPPFSFGSLVNVAQAWTHVLAFNQGAILGWVGNSVLYSGAALVLTLVVTIPAGYALSVGNFAGRRAVLVVTLVTMIMPGAALVLPIFLELSAISLVGTIWSVILPLSFFPFGVYLTFIYFSTAVPRELYEAARLDGCSEVGVFTRVAVPLAAPIIALVAFFSFVASWNNFFLPFVMLSGSDQSPLPVGLALLASSSPDFNPTGLVSGAPIYRPDIAVATIVTMLPVMVALLFAQRSILRSSSLVSGGVR